MVLVREVMYCKPGKVRAMVEKFTAMAALSAKSGGPKMRVMTDFCAERYWMVVMEFEIESVEAFEAMMRGQGQKPEAGKEMEKIMHGYHDLVEFGKRELYKLEN